jgi:hypothetical protein
MANTSKSLRIDSVLDAISCYVDNIESNPYLAEDCLYEIETFNPELAHIFRDQLYTLDTKTNHFYRVKRKDDSQKPAPPLGFKEALRQCIINANKLGNIKDVYNYCKNKIEKSFEQIIEKI